MSKPICVSCGRFYELKKNGALRVECIPYSESQELDSYKVWVSAEGKCPGCGHKILTDYPTGPYVVRGRSELEEIMNDLTPDVIQTDDR